METFGKIMAVSLGITIAPVIKGFVFAKLWLWFIVPIFEMQPLRIVEAIGILFTIQFIATKRDRDTDKEKFWDSFAINMIFVVLISALALFSGWIVKLFL